MPWYLTTNLNTALAGNYIGEVEVNRTVLHQAIFGKSRTIILYYYGDRDQELSEQFGYPPL